MNDKNIMQNEPPIKGHNSNMILFIWYVQNWLICREQSRLVVTWGWRGQENWGVMIKGYRAYFWGYENALKFIFDHNL